MRDVAEFSISVLTDPIIMSNNGRHGVGDLGREGIEEWFGKHNCSVYCKTSWLKPNKAKLRLDARVQNGAPAVPTLVGAPGEMSGARAPDLRAYICQREMARIPMPVGGIPGDGVSSRQGNFNRRMVVNEP